MDRVFNEVSNTLLIINHLVTHNTHIRQGYSNMRLISQTDHHKMYYNAEFQEYVIKPIATLKDENTWHYGDSCKRDAYGTMSMMDDQIEAK